MKTQKVAGAPRAPGLKRPAKKSTKLRPKTELTESKTKVPLPNHSDENDGDAVRKRSLDRINKIKRIGGREAASDLRQKEHEGQEGSVRRDASPIHVPHVSPVQNGKRGLTELRETTELTESKNEVASPTHSSHSVNSVLSRNSVKTSTILRVARKLEREREKVLPPRIDSFLDFLAHHARVKSGSGYVPYHFRGREALLPIVQQLDAILASGQADASLALCGGAQFGKTVLMLNLLAYLVAVRFRNVGYYLPDDDLVSGLVDGKLRPDVLDQIPWLARLLTVGKTLAPSGRAVNRKGAFLCTDGERSGLAFMRGLGKIPTSFSMDVVIQDEKDDLPEEHARFLSGRMTASNLRLSLIIGTQRYHGAGQNLAFTEGTQHIGLLTCPRCAQRHNPETLWPGICRLRLDGVPAASSPKLTLEGHFAWTTPTAPSVPPGESKPPTRQPISARPSQSESSAREAIFNSVILSEGEMGTAMGIDCLANNDLILYKVSKIQLRSGMNRIKNIIFLVGLLGGGLFANAAAAGEVEGLRDACVAGVMLTTHHIPHEVIEVGSEAGCIFDVAGIQYIYTPSGSARMNPKQVARVNIRQIPADQVVQIADGGREIKNGCLVFAACSLQQCRINPQVVWAGIVTARLLDLQAASEGSIAVEGHALTAYEDVDRQIFIEENGDRAHRVRQLTRLAQKGDRSWYDPSMLLLYSRQGSFGTASFAGQFGQVR
jgi:hypothetical protein